MIAEVVSEILVQILGLVVGDAVVVVNVLLGKSVEKPLRS